MEAMTEAVTEAVRIEGKKDESTVTPKGQRKGAMIDGVVMRPAVTHIDERGTMCELYDPTWAVHPDPLVLVSLYTILPGVAKGWVVHRGQDDRNFLVRGRVRWVLYDDRPESPTYRLVSEVYVSEYTRKLLVIPRGVFHAVQNVGEVEAMIVDMPNVRYNHGDPDKFRLPLHNDVIPFRFEQNVNGW
jgi:dTDP-4-dehydrorhamnose 3,5-epimerase